MAGEGPGPDEVLASLGAELARQVPAAVPAWARRAVGRVLEAWDEAGGGGDAARTAELLLAAEEAGRRAASVVAVQLGDLAGQDVDRQRTTPLEIVRRAVVAGPTEVLAGAGVPPVVRDPFAEERFPDDPYDLAPGSLAALDPSLGELALAWGAAKAAAHRTRHTGGPPAR